MLTRYDNYPTSIFVRALLAYLKLVRIPNCLIASVTVAAGQYLSPSAQALPLNKLAMATAFFVCGFGNIVNDILDVKSDAVNHPRRPLPAGIATIGGARALAGMFLIISLVLVFFLTIAELIIATVALVLLTLYNVRLKHTAFGGNIAVAFLGGITFVFGGATAGFQGIIEVPGAIVAAVFAFLMHFVREVVKDIQDVPGDVGIGSGTGPIKAGARMSLAIAYLMFGLLIICGVAVYWVGWFNLVFLSISVFTIYLPGIVQFIWMGTSPEITRCRVVSSLLKIEMLPGILAVLVGKSY